MKEPTKNEIIYPIIIYFSFIYLVILPSLLSQRFNTQCITVSSQLACVATLRIPSITYSFSPLAAIIKPSGLLNNSFANEWLVVI